MEASHALVLFREYMGCGLIVVWFLIALVYLFLKENQKPLRILFLYVPVILLLLFFNPLFEKAAYQYLKDEIYYRILWLLPMTVVLAYGIVKVCVTLKGRKRMAFALTAVALIMVSGKCIYANPNFSKAQNLYHVPNSVVHICDAIEIPGREVTAVFPLELVQYVRQYSPVVCMPYGREILVERWNHLSDLCDAMEEEVADAEKITRLAREDACVYIIFDAEKEVAGSFANFDYEEFARIDGYVIYKDKNFVP